MLERSSTSTPLFKEERMNSQRTSRPRITTQSDPADKGQYYPPLIYEFYASYGAAQKYQKASGPLKSRPYLEKVENMTAQNNTRLTSLIEHMPNMIKRAIDKALAPFHIKIQDLEHRVSELEGIGATDALATLKADISKVKIDVMDGRFRTKFPAPTKEVVGTIETTTTAQSEESEDA
ncbi:hypothetical protein HAX54_002153 [Datura stramonium]|uniref:Uncharacterized protein n=1 Tax=Datura stramonium TaxID=4076 RepID=A0ABS8T4M2_DATST|nr:hypothetical protein [Datura stramonium]